MQDTINVICIYTSIIFICARTYAQNNDGRWHHIFYAHLKKKSKKNASCKTRAQMGTGQKKNKGIKLEKILSCVRA